MTVLSARRFPHTITRRRIGPTTINDFGEPVQGTTTEQDFRANFQPLRLEDNDFVGGVQLQEQAKIYIDEPNALMAAFDNSPADRVLYRGREFVVTDSRNWPGAHTRAIVLRET